MSLPLNTEHRTLNTSWRAWRAARAAFTLIELISVLAICALLLSITLAAYIGWTRAAAVDDAAAILATSLDHAREQAITSRQTARLVCANTNRPGRPPAGTLQLYTLTDDTNTVLAVAALPVSLPADARFLFDGERAVDFLPDGTGRPVLPDASEGSVSFPLATGSGAGTPALRRVVDVSLLSGRVSVRREAGP